MPTSRPGQAPVARATQVKHADARNLAKAPGEDDDQREGPYHARWPMPSTRNAFTTTHTSKLLSAMESQSRLSAAMIPVTTAMRASRHAATGSSDAISAVQTVITTGPSLADGASLAARFSGPSGADWILQHPVLRDGDKTPLVVRH
jgi:hypothetical protein